MLGTAFFLTCFKFIRSPVSSALVSCLENNTGETFIWVRNWVAKILQGYGAPSRVLRQPTSLHPIEAVEDILSEILCIPVNDKIVGIWSPKFSQIWEYWIWERLGCNIWTLLVHRSFGSTIERLGCNDLVWLKDLRAPLDFHRWCAAMRFLKLEDFGRLSFDISDILGATKELKALKIRKCSSLNKLIFPKYKRTKLEELHLYQIPWQRSLLRIPTH